MAQHSGTTSTQATAVRLTPVHMRILRALVSLASAALFIRIMGMLNQIIVSSHFGAGASMDAYVVAASFPTLMSQLIIDAMEFSVIPTYTQVCTEGSREQASRLFSTLLNLLIITTVVITLLMIVFRYQIVLFSAPALDSFRVGLASNLDLLLFPAFLLMVVLGFLQCIFNAEGQFGWPAYAGMLVPLATAAVVIVEGSSLGVEALAIGMLLGLCLQFALFIGRAWQVGIVYRPVIDLKNGDILPVLHAAWPVFLGAFITQAGPLVDQVFASFLSVGSISALNYALKLISVPVGIVFVSVGRAALPYLSQQAAKNEIKAFKETLRLCLWAVGTSTLGLTLVMLLFAHILVRIIFQHGAFSADDTNRTANTLIGFTIGLTPMALGFILAKAFSALGKTKILMYVTIFSVVANAAFDAILASVWQSFGIALATSAVYGCTVCILLFTLNRTIGEFSLFTPPAEVVMMIQKLRESQYYAQWMALKTKIASVWQTIASFRLQILGIGLILTICVGVASRVLHRSFSLVSIPVGLLVAFSFLLHPYALLIAWVVINPLIGSPLPFFNGNHFLTDLIIPTLLLILWPNIRLKPVFERIPALVLLFIFLLWALASIRIAPIRIGEFLSTWITYLLYVAVAVLTLSLLTTRQRIMRLIDAMLLASLFIALYGFYGYFTRTLIIHDMFSSIVRMISIFGAAPTLALFLSIVIPLALYRTLTLQGFKRICCLLLIAILLVALAMTFTRTTYVCVPLSVIIMVFFLPSRKTKLTILYGMVALAVLVTLLTVVGHVPILSRFLNKDIITLNGRTYLWEAIWTHFDPTQVLGKGLKASDVLLTQLQVRDSTGNLIADAAHNLFLEILYDHGIIGVVLFTSVFVTLFVSLTKGIRKTTGEQRMLFVTALAILVSALLQSLESNDLLIYLSVGIYFWIVMALPFALHWPTEPQIATVPTPGSSEALMEPQEKMTSANGKSLAIPIGSDADSAHLRICFVSLLFAPSIGGAQIQLERQARQLQALGHDVMVVTLRHERTWKRTEVLDGLPVIRVGGIYRRNGQLRIGRLAHISVDIALFLALWRLRHRYDLIHVFQALTPAVVATFVGKLTHKPVVIKIQNTGPDEQQRIRIEQHPALMADTLTEMDFLKIDFKDWAPNEGDITYLPHAALGGRAMVNFLRKSDAFYHLLSKRSYSYLTAHGFRAEQMVHIPNGVDAKRFRPLPELAPTAEQRKIICVSRLEYNKGIDVLLHAWGRMMSTRADQHDDLKPLLQIVGDGALRSPLERLTTELDIQDSVEFLGTRTDIIEMQQQAWGFVLPSRWEGMPNALLEAMACGLPCIATRVSGSEEIIYDGVNGLLVDPEQPEAMAEALRRLIEDSELTQRLRELARITIIHDYQLNKVVEQCQALYRCLLTNEKPVASFVSERAWE